MAAYRRVYDSRHLQADCQEPGSAPELYARQSSMGYLFLVSDDVIVDFLNQDIMMDDLIHEDKCCTQCTAGWGSLAKISVESDGCSTVAVRTSARTIRKLHCCMGNRLPEYAYVSLSHYKNTQPHFVVLRCHVMHHHFRTFASFSRLALSLVIC